MRLGYAFCASAAEFTPDGKLWVLGGDFDTITAPGFPVVHPAMTLVIKLRVEITECDHQHGLRILLLDSDGAIVQGPMEVSFTAQRRPEAPHRPVGVGLAINFQSMVFAREGDFAFHILVDNLGLGTVQVYVIHTPSLPQDGTASE